MAKTQLDTSSVWLQLSSDLRRYIRRRVPDDHTADDLLQETFVRIHRGLSALDHDDRLTAWVYRITGNVLTDYYRNRESGPTAVDSLDDVPVSPSADRDRTLASAGQWLAEIVETLPETYRQAVHLAELEGLGQQEIADRLGLSLSATKSRVQRGRAALKDALGRCCRFEFDRRGNVLSCDPRADRKVCLECDDQELDAP